MRNYKKAAKLSLCVAIMAGCLSFTKSSLYAGSFSVGASPSTVEPGGSFTVNVSLNGAGQFSFSGNNASVSSSSIWCDTSCSITATAGSSGTASVTVTAQDATATDESPITGSQTASVNIASPQPSTPSGGGQEATQTPQTPQKDPTPAEKKNTDSSLAALSISAGKLSPDFKASTTAYKVDLEAGVSEINVSAKANDSKASVSGTGKISLDPGENSIKVVCTAEDGSATTYTINAYVNEKPVTTLGYNGKEIGILKNVKDAPALSKAFSETTVKINDIEVPAWKNEEMKLTLLYVKDENGKNFYIYDEEGKKITSIYRPISLVGLNLIQIDVPEDLQKKAGMEFTTVEIDKQKLPGWTFTDKAFENYAIIYMMDEGGQKQYYQYEKTQNRLQLYSGAAAITQENYEAFVKEKKDKEQTLLYVIYGLSAGLVVSLGLAGYFFFKKKTGGSKGSGRIRIEKENYEDRFKMDENNE